MTMPMAQVQAVPVMWSSLGQWEPIAPPPAWNSPISPQLWGILQSSQFFTIRQHVKLGPKNCCSCPPCVKQENSYSIYAGFTQNSEAEILRVDEVSDDWNRCCCAPYHPLRLEVRQAFATPGPSDDAGHFQSDVNNDWSRWGSLNGWEKQTYLNELYKRQPVLMSAVRDGGQRCCYKCPCKWLDTFVCFECCQDGMHLYAGPAFDEPDKERGLPYNLNPANLIGSVIQPNFGGWCWPTLHVRTNADDNSEPFAKVQGPFCFGGWSEMCCDFQFFVDNFKSESKTGDLALITKKKPASLMGAVKELVSDADNYTLAFNPAANMDAAQKASILTAQLFADYMWFDGNTEKCRDSQEAIYCYCWYCNVIGKICPCVLIIPKKQ